MKDMLILKRTVGREGGAGIEFWLGTQRIGRIVVLKADAGTAKLGLVMHPAISVYRDDAAAARPAPSAAEAEEDQEDGEDALANAAALVNVSSQRVDSSRGGNAL